MVVFSGTTKTDFMKRFPVENVRKRDYINYAGDDFLTLREDLINYIKAVYPLDYQNFSESDLGIMLIEVVAYMGAVVSLKSDMLANESFLRTVKSRSNLKKLLELVGVDMRAPLAAGGGGKLTIKNVTTSGDWTVAPAQRVFAVPGAQDGAPVNYTVYRIINNAIQDIQNATGTLTFTDADRDNPGGTDAIFTNVALLEGALRVQKGTFEADEGNKVISLNDSPIVEGSVQVYVTGGGGAEGIYQQVERLYSASGATDRVFQVAYDDDYGASILFGDNVVGVSPPPGASFTVMYRVGGGSRGNIRAESINVQTQVTDLSLGSQFGAILENRTALTGGSEAESSTHAKRYAPLTFKRQDRVVTLEDFIAIGNNFRSKQGTIGKTTAAVRDAFSSGNIIDLYTLEKASDLHLQKASSTFKKELLEEIEPKKMLTDQIVVCDGLIRTLDLVVTVRIDKELEPIKSEITSQAASIILEYFNIDNNEFGKPFIAADLNRKLYGLSTIRYSTIDNVGDVTYVDFNEIIQLNNFTVNSVIV